MKILALNSSPRAKGESKTHLFLSHLVKGMEEAGAEVETVRLRQKTIKPCLGCFNCWTKTPGLCIQKDDMTKELYPKLLNSDLVVFASPLYHFTMNATMKTFIERTLPVLEPFFKEKDGNISHPLRQNHPAVVVLSVAGFPNESVFQQLSSYVRFLYREGLMAEIYVPGAEMMGRPFLAAEQKDILAATIQAGRELAKTMQITPATLERIKHPLMDLQTFAAIGNAAWKTCITEGVTPNEMLKKGIMPSPDSIESFMTIIKMGFHPQAGEETKATIQFDFSGDVEGTCYLIINHGEIQAVSGIAENPDLTVTAPFELWMDIMTGKKDGQQMFLEQKYQVSGDFSLLTKMGELFGK